MEKTQTHSINVFTNHIKHHILELNCYGRIELQSYICYNIHWNGNVFILMKFSSLAALEVVKMTTSSAASD